MSRMHHSRRKITGTSRREVLGAAAGTALAIGLTGAAGRRLRTPTLTGPWSPETVVTTAQQYPQLYAPYITPLWNDGPDIYFNMSLYGPYAVYLMRTSLV
jgi:hypothetical protein